MQEIGNFFPSCIEIYMAQVTLRDGSLDSTQLVHRLAGYQMLPQLWREIVIDEAICSIQLSAPESAQAQKQFDSHYQLSTQSDRTDWGKVRGMTTAQVEEIATRELKIEKFKIATWGGRLESYFLTHKSKLDKVVYSLLRTPQQEIATELYFRIESSEQTFAELAREYSTGAEAQTGGLLGPIELTQPHPTLAKMLSISQPGQLWSPIQLGEWFVILRLEKFIPAVLNDVMRQQLLNGLFEGWIQEQVQQEIGGMVKGQRAKKISQPFTNSKTIQPTVSEAA